MWEADGRVAAVHHSGAEAEEMHRLVSVVAKNRIVCRSAQRARSEYRGRLDHGLVPVLSHQAYGACTSPSTSPMAPATLPRPPHPLAAQQPPFAHLPPLRTTPASLPHLPHTPRVPTSPPASRSRTTTAPRPPTLCTWGSTSCTGATTRRRPAARPPAPRASGGWCPLPTPARCSQRLWCRPPHKKVGGVPKRGGVHEEW